ncbi:hypothetical protein OS493_033406, partial [Desmophyllum pertusum]
TPCSSNPCINNATCVAKYEDNDYQCACAPGIQRKGTAKNYTMDPSSTTDLHLLFLRVHVWIAAGGKLFFRLANRQDAVYDFMVSQPLNSGQWIYVGASYDYNTGVARMWIDGTEVAQSNDGVFTLSTSSNVRIGVKSDDSRYFKGRIARVQVYNVALNLEQVLAVKTRGQS